MNRSHRPSPGSFWKNRTIRRRDGKWLDSTISGSILNNPLYVGQYVWNRAKFDKDPDSGKRVVVAERKEDECEHFACPELRIVTEALWRAVRKRRAARSAATQALECRPQDGRRPFRSRGGKALKYALSGLLRCAECGGSYAMADGRSYSCATNLNGGQAACPNGKRVKRVVLQEIVLGVLRTELLTPQNLEQYRRRIASGGAARNRERSVAQGTARRRLEAAEKVVANIMTAIKAGILTASTKAELTAAESEVAAARAALERGPQATPVSALPRAVANYESMVATLPMALNKDPDRAREILSALVGTVKMIRAKSGLFAELSVDPGKLLALAGCDGSGGRI